MLYPQELFLLKLTAMGASATGKLCIARKIEMRLLLQPKSITCIINYSTHDGRIFRYSAR